MRCRAPRGKKRVEAFMTGWDNFIAKNAEVIKLGQQNSNVVARRLQQGRWRQGVVTRAVRSAGSRAGKQGRPEDCHSTRCGSANVNAIASGDSPEDQARFVKLANEKPLSSARRSTPTRHCRRTCASPGPTIAPCSAQVQKIALENGAYKARRAGDGRGEKARLVARDALNTIISLNNEQLEQGARSRRKRCICPAGRCCWRLLGVSLLVGLTGTIWIVWSITRGVNSAVQLARAVAAGDLNASAKASTNDEIKDLDRRAQHRWSASSRRSSARSTRRSAMSRAAARSCRQAPSS